MQRMIYKTGRGTSDLFPFYVNSTRNVYKDIITHLEKLEEIEAPRFFCPLMLSPLQQVKLFICYLCRGSEKFIRLNEDIILNNKMSIRLHEQINFKGRGSKAHLKSLSGAWIPSPQLIKDYPKVVNCEMYLETEPACSLFFIYHTIIEKRLNVTFIGKFLFRTDK